MSTMHPTVYPTSRWDLEQASKAAMHAWYAARQEHERLTATGASKAELDAQLAAVRSHHTQYQHLAHLRMQALIRPRLQPRRLAGRPR